MRDAAQLIAALMALLIAASGGAREVPLAAEATIATATSTLDLRHADIDGDGDMDGVAVADGDVVWYDNTAGDGSAWTTRTIDFFDSLKSPQGVFPADVDGDGDVDVVSFWDRTFPVTDTQVGWHENTAGDGSAWTRRLIASGSRFDRIFAADMDRDGDLDVVTGGDLAVGIDWHDNVLGDGTFWTMKAVGLCDNKSLGLSVDDIDGDADPDILALCYQNSGDYHVYWFENTAGTGLAWALDTVDTWIALAPGGGNQNLLAVDVDADGDLDLAATAQYPGGLEKVYLNLSGDFTTRSLSNFPVPGLLPDPDTYAAGDLDQDGDVDVLAAGYTPAPPTPVEALGWWESTGPDTTTWTEHPVDGSGETSYAAFMTDLDGDGDLDVLASLSDRITTDWTAWYENLTIHRSALFPDQRVINGTGDDPIGIVLADIDGDADLDVVTAEQLDGTLTWHENDGASPPSFTSRTIISLSMNLRQLAVADLDRDGDLDVISDAVSVGRGLRWYRNDGAQPPSWTLGGLISSFYLPDISWVTAGDLDGDGDPDVIGCSGSEIGWAESDGSSSPLWTSRTIAGVGASSVATADVNGDGDLDVISAGVNSAAAWFENDGASPPSFSAHTIDATPGFALSALPADVDGDGDIDIVHGHFDADRITWYENNGASLPTWTARTITSAADGVISVFPADLDGDGDVDVVGGTANSGIVWYESDGATPPVWNPHPILPPSGNNFRVVTGDLDHDGDVDVVATAPVDDTVAWYPNQGGQFKLATTDTAPAALGQGTRDDVLSIDITHNGRSGDSDLEVASIELRFEDSLGTPLTTSEASALLAKIGAWAELGTPGVWDPATDLLVTELTSFTLIDGRLTIPLADGDPLVQLPTGMTATGHIVLDATADGASQSPNAFRVTHVTESSTSAEDASHDIPLTLEFTPDVTTKVITVPELGGLLQLLAGVGFLVAAGRRRARARGRLSVLNIRRS